uniref:Uncharacterized protein n=1 Tax=Opuntia streptacantha TaxID=393608 RepID=A0A7C9AMB1_OPUST
MKESSSLSPLFISLNIATQLTDSDALVHRKELDLADLQLHLFKQSHSMMFYDVLYVELFSFAVLLMSSCRFTAQLFFGSDLIAVPLCCRTLAPNEATGFISCSVSPIFIALWYPV